MRSGVRVAGIATVMCLVMTGCGANSAAEAEAEGGACQYTKHGDAETAGGKKADGQNVPVIKGYITSNDGSKIYYVPGAQAYKRVRIDESKGMRFFCTEKEAQEAGWRKSTV